VPAPEVFFFSCDLVNDFSASKRQRIHVCCQTIQDPGLRVLEVFCKLYTFPFLENLCGTEASNDFEFSVSNIFITCGNCVSVSTNNINFE